MPPDERHSAECVATNQGENDVSDTTLIPTFDTRLAALDRAINYSHDHELTPDEVVRIAAQFEEYLTRTDG